MPGVRRMLAGVAAIVAVVAALVVVLGGDDEDRRGRARATHPAAPRRARDRVRLRAAHLRPGRRASRAARADRDGPTAATRRRCGRRTARASRTCTASRRPAGAPRAAIDLYVMGADGSGRTRVATGLAVSPSLFYGAPFAWSPDGTKLAVSLAERRRYVERSKRELFTRALTGPPSDLHLVDLASRRTHAPDARRRTSTACRSGRARGSPTRGCAATTRACARTSASSTPRRAATACCCADRAPSTCWRCRRTAARSSWRPAARTSPA